MPKRFKDVGLFLALISMVVLPVFAERTVVRPASTLFSTQQDIEMGRVLAGDAERTFQLVSDGAANAYVTALGGQLSAHAPNARFPYQFKVVNDDAVNVWALPGGSIFVSAGVIDQARSEPELAGALAHAIAHAALRHGSAAVSQAYSDRVGGGTRNRVSVNDAMSRLNIRFEPNALPLTYTREQERQASLVATQIMYDTQFDPQQMAQFFADVVNDRSSRTADFMDAHPLPANQTAMVRTESRNIGALPRNLRGDSPDFHSVQDRVVASASNRDSWPSIYDRDDGVTGDVPDLPSTRTVVYRGRDLEFRYPNNWRVSEEGDAISVAPDGGIVSGSLAYGMTISTFEPQGRFGRNSFSTPSSRADTTTLSGATDQLIQHLQESNPSMRIMRNSERRRVDGLQAMVVELRNESPVGGNETDWLVTVMRPNGTLQYFVGAAPERDFSRYQPAFDQIVSSVRILN